MNILQLLTSLNDDISVRAIAAYSKILKDNGYNSYVFAPLGRELSYFKRWGAEIVGQSDSSEDIIYSKANIKKICEVLPCPECAEHATKMWNSCPVVTLMHATSTL